MSSAIEMYKWASDLFPINRSIMGPGVRETLNYLKKIIPSLKIHSVKTGTQAFDWTVPKEWLIRDAFVEDEYGNRVIDYKKNNLHVVGYSTSFDGWLSLDDLQGHLYSLDDQPNAIPYITSYYKEQWGFCLSLEERNKLKPGKYRVRIDAELLDGELNYGEVIFNGLSNKEVFLSTYICHPSMANNELSGPVVATQLLKWICSQKNRKYTYRAIFIPETIGSIVYLSRNIEELKKNVIAGFNITCVGDDRCYSYLPSRMGNTLSDQVALHVLKHTDPNFKKYTFLSRGSDERQYCAPGVDLPIASIMRSKYGEYPEYHTSLDNLDLISPEGLYGAFIALRRSIDGIEKNVRPKAVLFCEPQMGRRGLYENLSLKGSSSSSKTMMDYLAFSDGNNTHLEIAEILNLPLWELYEVNKILLDAGLIVNYSDYE